MVAGVVVEVLLMLPYRLGQAIRLIDCRLIGAVSSTWANGSGPYSCAEDFVVK